MLFFLKVTARKFVAYKPRNSQSLQKSIEGVLSVSACRFPYSLVYTKGDVVFSEQIRTQSYSQN